MELVDLLLGEPEYDENGKFVKRNLGLKNVFVWLAIAWFANNYLVTGKQRGGGGNPEKADSKPEPFVMSPRTAQPDRVHRHNLPQADVVAQPTPQAAQLKESDSSGTVPARRPKEKRGDAWMIFSALLGTGLLMWLSIEALGVSCRGCDGEED